MPKPVVPVDDDEEKLSYSSDEDKNILKMAIKTVKRNQRRRRQEFAEKHGDGT